jgi:hypothetical protein
VFGVCCCVAELNVFHPCAVDDGVDGGVGVGKSGVGCSLLIASLLLLCALLF